MATLTLLASEVRRIRDASAHAEQGQKAGGVGTVDGGLGGLDEDSRPGWLEGGEAESVSIAARKTADEHEIKGEPEIRVLNLGKG